MAAALMMVDAALLAELRLTADLPDELRMRIAAVLAPVHLPGGRWLFRQGDVGEAMFLVHSGRLEVVRTTNGVDQVVGLLQAGDSFGELALLEGGTRAAGVRAIRDSSLLALHRDDLTALMGDRPFAATLLAQVTKLLRTDPPAEDQTHRRTVVAVVGVDPREGQALTAALERSFDEQRIPAAVLRDADVDHATADLDAGVGRRLDELEATHDVVLLDGGSIGSPWSRLCTRQADRVIVVPDRRAAPLEVVWPDLDGCDLVVAGDRPPSPGRLDALAVQLHPRTHVRLRDGHRRGDVDRLARRLAHRALGLVMAGGGARGMAHVGVLEAIEESGLTIDRYGGTSMGAFVSGLAAGGRSAQQIRRLVHAEMVRRKPFRDYTWPRRSLIRGVTAERMLRRVFGDGDVRDLPHPWFAVSASLYDAELVEHRDGPVWEAAACSMSLPGIAPPRVWRDRVVVDGGVLDNLPVATMVAEGEGKVVAVDLTRPRAPSGASPQVVPGIVQTLSTTMTLSNLQVVERNRRLAHLVIDPGIADVELLDFGAVERTMAAGYEAALHVLRANDLLHTGGEGG